LDEMLNSYLQTLNIYRMFVLRPQFTVF